MPRQRRVVYILGAGFSAPLGIPTIASFLQSAKDLAEEQPSQFSYFDDVFRSIQILERANNFYSTDRTNIEDLLTIMDLSGQLAEEDEPGLFRRFIRDVIVARTPSVQGSQNVQAWYDMICGRPWTPYVVFTAALLGYEIKAKRNFPPGFSGPVTSSDYSCSESGGREVAYSVITLNYDAVLETANTQLNGFFGTTRAFEAKATAACPLIKLHGSIANDGKDIVPPVWNKSYRDVSGIWKEALLTLKAANEIRLIGYSLPQPDSQLRYLLRAAAVETRNLRRIDVLCLDPRGEVRTRYQEFVELKDYYRDQYAETGAFQERSVSDYLLGYQDAPQWPNLIRPHELLERSHSQLFGS